LEEGIPTRRFIELHFGICGMDGDLQPMDFGLGQTGRTERVCHNPAGSWMDDVHRRGTWVLAQARGEASMEPEARAGRMEAVAARPLAELLQCPEAAGNLLNGAAQCIAFDAGAVVFRQFGVCQGLYVVVSGLFMRRTERLETRLNLGPARTGDLVELGAVLGEGRHTYTLTAQTPGSVLLLPMETLNQAFQKYPPLRMQLLEELAREVSRAYLASCHNRSSKVRRRGGGAALA
jgi:hypothetical protein